MSRRKTPGVRAAQSKRNAGKRTKEPAISAKQIMIKNRIDEAREKAAREVAEVYAGVLVEVGEEYYDGEVKYSALRAVDDKKGQQMQTTVDEKLKPYLAVKQTAQLVSEAADIIQELNQGWIDTGWLVPVNLRLWDTPTARIYSESGDVEAVNRARDVDIVDMGARYKKALDKYKAAKKKVG